MTATKQSTTKPPGYFMGNSVSTSNDRLDNWNLVQTETTVRCITKPLRKWYCFARDISLSFTLLHLSDTYFSFRMSLKRAIFTLSLVYIERQPLHRSHQLRISVISLYTTNKTSHSLQICNVSSYVYSYFECIFIQNTAGIGLRLTRPCHTAITNSHEYITLTTNR